MGGGDLRILVSLRSDAASKPGGDVNLLRGFAKELAARHEVETIVGVPSSAQLSGQDVVLTANLDRPVEPAVTLALATRAGVPMLHYALHHPAAGVSAYLHHGVHGVRRQLGRLAGGSPTRYEQLLWTLHAGSDLVRQRRVPSFGSVARAQRALLDSARLVVSSHAEAAAIAADIGPIGTHHIVPHPTDFPAGTRQPVKGRVVVPGRIESRKNQLFALGLAKRFPEHAFLFVGGFIPSDRRYRRRFLEAMADTANATHIEHLPKEEFYPLLLTAEAVLSASWFEVTSLVELYCAANGVPLAVSEHSYLGGHGPIHRFDPRHLDRGAEALAASLDPAMALPETPAPGRMTTTDRTIVDVVEAMSAPIGTASS